MPLKSSYIKGVEDIQKLKKYYRNLLIEYDYYYMKSLGSYDKTLSEFRKEYNNEENIDSSGLPHTDFPKTPIQRAKELTYVDYRDMIRDRKLVTKTADIPTTIDLKGNKLQQKAGYEFIKISGKFIHKNETYICIWEGDIADTNTSEGRYRRLSIWKENGLTWSFVSKKETWPVYYSNRGDFAWYSNGKIYTNTVSSDTYSKLFFDIETKTFGTHEILNGIQNTVFYKSKVVGIDAESKKIRVYDSTTKTEINPVSADFSGYHINVEGFLKEKGKIIIDANFAYDGHAFLGTIKFDIESLKIDKIKNKDYLELFWHEYRRNFGEHTLFICVDKILYIGTENVEGYIGEYSFATNTKSIVRDEIGRQYLGTLDSWSMNPISSYSDFAPGIYFKNYIQSKDFKYVNYNGKKCVLNTRIGAVMALDNSFIKQICSGELLGYAVDGDKLCLYEYADSLSVKYYEFDLVGGN